MKRIVKNKIEKKPLSKGELMDQIVPKRGVASAAEKLREFKESNQKPTVPVSSLKYGFKKALTLFVSPDLTREQIIEKFEKRFNASDINMYNVKRELRVKRTVRT